MQRTEVMLAINENLKDYEVLFGAPIAVIDVNEKTGVVEVGVDAQGEWADRTEQLSDGTPVYLYNSGKQGIDFQSRAAETPPWTAGSRITL